MNSSLRYTATKRYMATAFSSLVLADEAGRFSYEIPKEKLPPLGGPCHECTKYGIDCAAGMSSFSIDWKGTVRLCNRIEQYEAYPLTEGFPKSWSKLHEIAAHWPKVPECEGRPYRQACNACVARAICGNRPANRTREIMHVIIMANKRPCLFIGRTSSTRENTGARYIGKILTQFNYRRGRGRIQGRV